MNRRILLDLDFRWLVLAALAWLAVSAIPTSSAYIIEGSRGFARWLLFLGYIGSFYLMWMLLSPLVHKLSGGLLHPRNGWPRAVVGHGLVLVAAASLFALVVHQPDSTRWLWGQNAPGYWTMSVCGYLLILLCSYIYRLQQTVASQAHQIARQREHELLLENSLARSQMDSLRDQMNPHFLFNALNGIGALIQEHENEQAYTALESLAGLLRTSLEHGQRELIPLSSELTFVKRYLQLEELRFSDRMTAQLNIAEQCLDIPVPPFILQPLIENAIKHAVAPSMTPVSVEVTANCTGENLELAVRDTGAGSSQAGTSGTGVGLSNLRQRLQLYYGDRADLRFESGSSGTQVRMSLPTQPRPAIQPRQAA